MKKLTILTVILLLTALAQLTTQPVQAEVSIPDGNLAAAIRQTLGLPTDAVITADAMLDLTSLDARGKGIAALTGLEHAVNLTWLYLGGAWVGGETHTNPISDVSPLANLTQLETLSLRGTAVSDVSPLANLTQLTDLELEDTAVSDVSPLANLTQLTWLSLAGTAVSDVSPLANLTQLTWLYLGSTGVSDVSPLAALTQLKGLNLGWTAVLDVSPLANLTQLTRLNLLITGVSDVSPLANLTQLTELNLNYTAVSDVSPLAALTQLTELGLGWTAVSDVSPLAALTQLTELGLGWTAVSDVSPLVNLTQLEWLGLQNCPLNADAHQTHIPAIQANGTEVIFDPFKPIHLQRVPWLVSLIYFRPSDRPVRPDVDAEIDALIKKAQHFFADQLELHGFERKTFQFETDAHGNAVVHHVNGKFPNAHYQQNSYSWVDEIREQIYIPARSITVHMLDSDPGGTSFTGAAGTGGGGNHGGSVDIDNWYWKTIAHELAHAFGLQHDYRSDAKAKRIKTFTDDPMLTSFCAAEWLSVHPAFNPGQPVSTRSATIEMLPPTLASPPNTIRLRFEVTEPDGLHQAQLRIPDYVRYSGQYSRLIDFQPLNGHDNTVEFVTTQLTPRIENVTLSVIDVRGHMSGNTFDIDVPSLIPPAKVVSIPDPNLAAAVRESLKMSSSEPITTHSILNLVGLEASNRGIKDLTGLEHAVNLKELDLGAISDLSPLSDLTNLEVLSVRNFTLNPDFLRELPPLAPVSIPDPNLAAAIRKELLLTSNEPVTTHSILSLVKLEAPNRGIKDLTGLAHAVNLTEVDLSAEHIIGEGWVNSNAISDWSPLVGLTQLTTLGLSGTAVSDVSPLAALTQLTRLDLYGTGVSDVSPLAALTQLTSLDLNYTDVSDVSPLAALTQLTSLDLRHTAVSDVSPLAALTQLTRLDLFDTAVSDVSPLAALTQLTRLYLFDTAVSDVSPLANLTQLTYLYLGDTAVSDVSPLAALTQLTRLSLGGTGVSDVSPLAALTQLTRLSLGGTGVSDVSPLANLTQLEWLFLGGTGVSNVSPLAALTQLTWLDLFDTAVSDVSPLAALTQLTRLSLGFTAVSDVSPLANLTQLKYLDLRHTAVSDVSPLLGLNLPGTSWDSIGLWLTGSPLSYASLHTHIPALQAKGIEVEFDNVAHPALLKTSGDGQEGIGRSALPKPFVVEAMDEHGDPMVGKTVAFDILAGGGILSAQTATTDAQGTAQVTLTLGAAAGINKVKASSEGIQSWVLCTAAATEEAPQLVSDVNGDGSVNIQDLVLVSGQLGKTGKNSADVNGDGVVNIQDLVLVAGAFGEGAAAPSARAVSLSRLTASDVEGWLIEARAVSSVGQERLILTSFSRQTHILSDSGSGDPELQNGSASRTGGLSYLRGIAVLEQLLATLIPKATALLANYPNPFNPETWIPYQLANPAEVTVTIYAANGAVVRTLDLGHQRAGSYASRSRAAYWDGRNSQGEPVASGVYFYTLQAGDFTATKKMVIRK